MRNRSSWHWAPSALGCALALVSIGCGGDGARGAPGVNGTDGLDGTDGIPGRNGADGTKGLDGTDGTDGTDGEPGADGRDGRDGGQAPGAQGYLLVAELESGHESIHAYSLPDFAYTGSVGNVRLGNHLGTLVLADGRVLATDEKHKEIIAIQMDEKGRPVVVNSVAADIGDQAVWACGDVDLRYLAVASGHPGLDQVASILNVGDFSVTSFPITLKLEEELHSFIAGSPSHLFLSIGGEIQAFPLADVLAGTAATPVATIPVNLGSHGPVVSHDTERVYVTTKPGTGFDGVNFGEVPFTRVEIIPWDVDGRSMGQNFRPRLSWDSGFIYGALAQPLPAGPENWAAREVDFHAANLETETAKRLPLTSGIVPKFQLSRPYAFFANISAAGDFGILVDTEPTSPTVHEVVARIPLAALADGPKPGVSNVGAQTRGSAITPDGRWAFVSHGGEGKVSVIDTQSQAVVATIDTPTSLVGGGYLVAVQPGNTPVDTCMR